MILQYLIKRIVDESESSLRKYVSQRIHKFQSRAL